VQGRLGDCWVLCAIAALAEYPHLIKRLFVTEEEDGEEGRGVGPDTGLYKMRFCKNGRWQVREGSVPHGHSEKSRRADDSSITYVTSSLQFQYTSQYLPNYSVFFPCRQDN
jgi:hypothetical protein